MSEISSLAIDKDIVDMVTALIGVSCLVIGGVIGFFTKYFYESKKMKENKKALRQQMITNNIAPMRQAWINEVRGKVADFLALHDSIDTILSQDRDNGFNMFESEVNKNKEIFDLLTKTVVVYHNLNILLPINETNSDNLRSDLKKLIGHISKENERLTDNEVDTYIDSVIKNTKLLLKEEWNVTKSLKEIE